MFAVIYCWKLVVGREAQFEEGWRAGTDTMAKELGGWGSRLHRGDDGTVVAYAQWPDRATWESSTISITPASQASRRAASRDERRSHLADVLDIARRDCPRYRVYSRYRACRAAGGIRYIRHRTSSIRTSSIRTSCTRRRGYGAQGRGWNRDSDRGSPGVVPNLR